MKKINPAAQCPRCGTTNLAAQTPSRRYVHVCTHSKKGCRWGQPFRSHWGDWEGSEFDTRTDYNGREIFNILNSSFRFKVSAVVLDDAVNIHCG